MLKNGFCHSRWARQQVLPWKLAEWRPRVPETPHRLSTWPWRRNPSANAACSSNKTKRREIEKREIISTARFKIWLNPRQFMSVQWGRTRPFKVHSRLNWGGEKWDGRHTKTSTSGRRWLTIRKDQQTMKLFYVIRRHETGRYIEIYCRYRIVAIQLMLLIIVVTTIVKIIVTKARRKRLERRFLEGEIYLLEKKTSSSFSSGNYGKL